MLRLLVLLLAILLSCQRKETELVREYSRAEDPAPADTSQEIATANEVVAVHTPPVKVEILFTGTFHSDEVQENIEALPWLGLFSDENGNFILTKDKIVAERVIDGLVDDEAKGERTGWSIATASGQHPTVLVSGGEFNEGKVDGGQVPGTIYPADSVRLNFKGFDYLIYATGLTHFDSVSGVKHVSQYNLFVGRLDNGKSAHTSLVSHESFDDAMTTILWSGDIDRDGYLDFLIDLSGHYNKRLPTLFLSKQAKNGHVVTPVAEHSSAGC